MPVNLSIKNAPDHIVARLRERARRHHRSLQGELLAIIENAMNLKNIDTFYQYVIRGTILLLAVIIDRLKQR